MGEIVQCPEGVEIDFVIYLTSESTGIDVRFALKGMPAFVGFEKACDPAALEVASGASRFAPDWRMMTRAEIAEYKRGEDPDDGDSEEES
jgi:hypothetical protein